MKPRAVHLRKAWLPLLLLLTFPHDLAAQQDKVAALKQSLAANAKLQKQYRWVETTVISMKGEEKSRVQKQCFYGPDGKVQKQQLTAPPQQSAPGGVKGKMAAKKKEEITAAMNQAVGPDPASTCRPIRSAFRPRRPAGNLAVVPSGPDSVRLDLKNYVKSGDTLSLGLDTKRNALQTISVKSYLESQSDAIGTGRDVCAVSAEDSPTRAASSSTCRSSRCRSSFRTPTTSASRRRARQRRRRPRPRPPRRRACPRRPWTT